ncbi:hypothetical protein JCM15640A_07400 [Hoylesella timonensis 4401737 = DSM 22865 = JCM 15640]
MNVTIPIFYDFFFYIIQSSFMRILFRTVFILIYEDMTIIIFLTFWRATVNDIKYGGNFYEIDIMQRKNIRVSRHKIVFLQINEII